MDKRIISIFIAAILFVSTIIWISCTKEPEINTGSIYGTVTDFATGRPIGNVNVRLRPSGETKLTGNDGTYEFKDLDEGNYSLFFSKAEYADFDDDSIIVLEAGKSMQHDIQMRKLMASLRITDMTGNDIPSLDFGSDEFVTSKSFNIFNDGTVSISCQIMYSCPWIDTAIAAGTNIAPGQAIAVTVIINRSQLSSGENRTYLHIISNNGNNELLITAIGPGAPTVTTNNVSGLTATSAICGGNVTDDGGSTVTDRGICWATTNAPSIESGYHLSNGTGTGTYSITMSGLSTNTVYYVRAFATNVRGISYGEEKQFTTNDGKPSLTINQVSNITATSAVCGGSISSNGGFAVSDKGLVWSNTQYPTLNDNHISLGSGDTPFSGSMTNLSMGTTYYVRTYATNANGTAYSDIQRSFSTTSGLPTVTTNTVSNVAAASAVCGGSISSDGGYTISDKGLVWSTSQQPTLSDNHLSKGNGNAPFTGTMTNLSFSTTYYVRAYATNANGTVYGEQRTFTTTDGLPAVTTNVVTNITASSAVCGGSISTDGGYTINDKGLVWSTSQMPTLSDNHLSSGNGNAPFTGTMTNLSLSTTYYVRAYATNANGTVYGEQRTFTTTDGLPVVTTIAPTRNNLTVTSGGNVTSDGGYAITARGICYSTAPYPDLSSSHSHTTNGTGTGSYSSSFTMSSQGVYYVRAYATNSVGTTYGEQDTINHPYNDLPTFTYGGQTYRIAPSASATMTWSNANSYCNNLTLYGYSDWRLPTQAELTSAFCSGLWSVLSGPIWSSNQCNDGSAYPNWGHVTGDNSAIGCFGYDCHVDSDALYVRPVRVEN